MDSEHLYSASRTWQTVNMGQKMRSEDVVEQEGVRYSQSEKTYWSSANLQEDEAHKATYIQLLLM